MKTRLCVALAMLLLGLRVSSAGFVEGPDPAGAAARANPMLLGAVDPDGTVQRVKINAGGELVVSGGTSSGGTSFNGVIHDGTTSSQTLAIDASGRITFLPTRGADTDRSGTITAGGTAQQIMSSNATRLHLLVQNVSDTDQWICWTGTATAGAGSVKLAAGASYENPAHFCPTGAVSIFCSTTGKAFTATEH